MADPKKRYFEQNISRQPSSNEAHVPFNDRCLAAVEDNIAQAVEDYLIANPPAGSGDMMEATYDPNGVHDDAFDMDNMVDGTYVKTENNLTDALLADLHAPGSDDQVIPVISDTAYDASSWDNNLDGATKNAIRDKIETLIDLVYAPTVLTVNKGTLDTGVVADLAALGGTNVNVSEANGAAPLQVDLTFSSVVRMDSFVLFGKYKGGAGHTIVVSVKQASAAVYDTIGIFGNTTGNQWYSFNIFNQSFYNNAGTVVIRLDHPDNGVNTHDLILDFVELKSGGGGAGGNAIQASSVEVTPAGNITETNVQEALEELDSIKGTSSLTLSDIYPIGAIYMSVVNTSPATLFGGTWAAIAAGRVLVGLDSGDADFDVAEETGGSKTVQSSAQSFGGNALATHQHAAISAGTPAGTVAAPVFTGTQIGTHQHAAISAGTPGGTVAAPAFTGTQSTVIVNHTHDVNVGSAADISSTTGSGNYFAGTTSSVVATTGNPKSGGAASYTPAGTNSAPAFSGTALATHQHDAITAGTPAGTNNAPAFTGSALGTHQHDAITAGTPSGTNTPGAATSVVQPYFICYMWKRTA